MRYRLLVCLGFLQLVPFTATMAVEKIPATRAQPIEAAAPERPRVAPHKPRRVLIWVTPEHLMPKDPHKGYNIPYAVHAMSTLGKKSGAFTPVISQNVTTFLPENLEDFDAIILCNASGSWLTPSETAMRDLASRANSPEDAERLLRESLVNWLRDGGGIMAFHYAIGANRHWPEFKEILGAGYWGHPWNEEIGVDVEEPEHPLNAAFEGGSKIRVADEIFQFNDPYSRDKLRVLLSVDTTTTNMGVKWVHRDDNDFALAWVKPFGDGRIFYTAFGHRPEIFSNPQMLQFYLDGIQFAVGDLDAPLTPRRDRPVKTGPGPSSAETKAARMAQRNVVAPSDEQIRQIRKNAPEKAPADPSKPRKVLVWGHVWTHQPNPFAEAAVRILGEKTGAFSAVISDDPRLLLGDRLPQFDALVMNNIHEREPFLPENFRQLGQLEQAAARKLDEAIKGSILEFVRSGKGIVGIHAATAALQNWPEYGEMMGAYYGGHIHQQVSIRIEDPRHPVTACFDGEPWQIHDEIYIAREPYSRDKLNVLLSLDLERMQDPGKRPDGDYAVSWVRQYGAGRVFYTTLGHDVATYWNPRFLEHVLAGIQFATGDLR
jgi:type 1 glutamine amidotransferase